MWDYDLLDMELEDITFDMEPFGFLGEQPIFDTNEDPYANPEQVHRLTESFIVPPFSVLDTRQGYWQDRKRAWKALGIESEKGRAESLLFDSSIKKMADAINFKSVGTSIFDPVLCEIMYTWFNVQGGKIFDPFAGGSVRGIVAAYLGYDYTGIDLRQEQVDANIENAKKLNLNPVWICDDSLNSDVYVQDESADMVMSCPPYADLEKYSDDPRDLSNMAYDDFMRVYREIIVKSVKIENIFVLTAKGNYNVSNTVKVEQMKLN